MPPTEAPHVAAGAASAQEQRPHPRSSLFGGLIFTIVLLGSIALAIRNSFSGIAGAALAAVLVLVVIFHFALRASDFFEVIFANSVGVYTCLFIVFLSTNFPESCRTAQQVAYLLPLIGFAVGVLAARRTLFAVVAAAPRHRARAMQGAVMWLGPLAGVAVVTSFLRIPSWSAEAQDTGLITAMAFIGLIGLGASRAISLFLMETGAVFRSFFANAVRLVQPAFALLTCYSLVIILFGAAYTIFDQMSVAPNFATLGKMSPMSFPEGLYLSVATLTMVGYGDITPVSAVARLFVSLELVCGVILLLFGVEAMLQRGTQSS